MSNNRQNFEKVNDSFKSIDKAKWPVSDGNTTYIVRRWSSPIESTWVPPSPIEFLNNCQLGKKIEEGRLSTGVTSPHSDQVIKDCYAVCGSVDEMKNLNKGVLTGRTGIYIIELKLTKKEFCEWYDKKNAFAILNRVSAVGIQSEEEYQSNFVCYNENVFVEVKKENVLESTNVKPKKLPPPKVKQPITVSQDLSFFKEKDVLPVPTTTTNKHTRSIKEIVFNLFPSFGSSSDGDFYEEPADTFEHQNKEKPNPANGAEQQKASQQGRKKK